MLNQSYRQIFVSNTGALLASGSTVENLAVGQFGIVDAKTNLAVTAPTYATTKAFRLVWGTPDINTGLWGGVPNENEYTKLIKGKLIKGFRAKKAAKPQNQRISIGWSGDVSDTATLSANAGETKFLYLNFTGSAIDKLFTTQGLVRQYAVDTSCWTDSSDCASPCQDVDPCRLAEEFVKQINGDKAGHFPVNRLVRAKAITECSASPSVNCYVFQVDLCDDGSAAALGLVQAQYPGLKVTRVGRISSTSTYQVTLDVNSAPADVSNAGMFFIPDCPTCPAGYTALTNKFVYSIKRVDAGDATALTAIETDYSVAGAESATRVNYDFGVSTYIVAVTAAISAAVDQDVLEYLGQSAYSCVLTTPTTTEWVLTDTLKRFEKTYRITLGDTVCGDDRLADLSAAYPDLVITLVDADGSCVHTYETTIYSNCVAVNCGVDEAKFVRPANFEGVYWEEYVAPATVDTTKRAGIIIEVAFVNRVTGECTFDYFPAYEYDTLFVHASQFNPDWSSSNCEATWVVRQLQGFKPPIGDGAYVRSQEKMSKSYDHRYRSFNPVIREMEGYEFQADPMKYYDEYTIEFDYKHQVGGWSKNETDSYHVSLFVPTGSGKEIESAINGYIQSAAIQIDPIAIAQY